MVRFILKEETYPLRKSVLRKGIENPDVAFAIDNQRDTFHLGYFKNDQLVGIVTVGKGDIVENCERYNIECIELKEYKDAYQLRGMAVDENFQKQNIGKSLLQEVDAVLKNRNTTHLWCNARLKVVNFYKKNGYQVLSNEFEVPLIGPHYLMGKEIS